jgi:hypothetical protein
LLKKVTVGGGEMVVAKAQVTLYVSPDVRQPGETNMQVPCCGVEPIFLLTNTAGVSRG